MDKIVTLNMVKSIIVIVIAVILLCSCTTYRRSKCIKEWVNPQQNIRYSVYLYSYYYRHNDSLYCVAVDTTKTNLNHREEIKTVKESRKICMDDYGK